MSNDELECGGGAASPIVAVIDCRGNGVHVATSVDVQAREHVTLVPSPAGGIVIVGEVNERNQAEVLETLELLSNRLGDGC